MVEQPTSSERTHRASVERRGDRELVVTRLFDASRDKVYRGWSEAALFRRWWVPGSMPSVRLVDCSMDVRTGGGYRLEFGTEGPETMAFHGRYLEVVPNEKIVWTNEEEAEGAVTTVSFAAEGPRTLLTFREVYPTPEGREEALQGSAAGLPEQLDQLEDLLPTL